MKTVLLEEGQKPHESMKIKKESPQYLCNINTRLIKADWLIVVVPANNGLVMSNVYDSGIGITINPSAHQRILWNLEFVSTCNILQPD